MDRVDATTKRLLAALATWLETLPVERLPEIVAELRRVAAS